MAKQQLTELLNAPQKSVDKNLFFIHSFVAAMQWRINDSINFLRLLHLTRVQQ